MAFFGFESETWTLGGASIGGDSGATVQSSVVRTGANALRLQVLGSGSPDEQFAESPNVIVNDAGVARNIVLRIRATRTSSSKERVLVEHYPNGTAMARATLLAVSSTFLSTTKWTDITLPATPNGPDDQIYLQSDWTGPPPNPPTPNKFYIDDIYYGNVVAIKLGERAVDAMVTLLQSDLATELTAIDTERADGLTMAAPANSEYYKYPKPVIGSKVAHIEVFESTIDFDNPYSDADAQRATYDIPVTVRATWFNRDADTKAKMVTRGRRYATGIFNVFNKNFDLADSDDSTMGITVLSATPGWESLDETEPGLIKGQVEIQTSVKCEEVQS